MRFAVGFVAGSVSTVAAIVVFALCKVAGDADRELESFESTGGVW